MVRCREKERNVFLAQRIMYKWKEIRLKMGSELDWLHKKNKVKCDWNISKIRHDKKSKKMK